MAPKILNLTILAVSITLAFIIWDYAKHPNPFQLQIEVLEQYEQQRKAEYQAYKKKWTLPRLDCYYEEFIYAGEYELKQGNYKEAVIYLFRAKTIYPKRLEIRLLLAKAAIKTCINTSTYCGNARRELRNAYNYTPIEEQQSLKELLVLEKQLEQHLVEQGKRIRRYVKATE